jgi:hypothetical protein
MLNNPVPLCQYFNGFQIIIKKKKKKKNRDYILVNLFIYHVPTINV